MLDSNDPSTERSFSFITSTNPITLIANTNINVPVKKLINDADATFSITAKSSTNVSLCAVTVQGDTSIDVEPKSADPYRCTASVSGDGMVTFTVSPSK